MTQIISMQLIFFVVGTLAVSKFLIDCSADGIRLNFSRIACIGVMTVSFLMACLM